MYAISGRTPISRSQLCRWLAGLTGVALFATWTTLVAVESTRPAPDVRPVGIYIQAAALLTVFLGYAVGWKRELLGAVLVVAAVFVYLVVTAADAKMLPGLPIVWFVAPAILYLLARRYRHGEHLPTVA